MNDPKSTPDLNTRHGRLRASRIRAGFRSAEKAAEHIGVGATTYRSHENGFRNFFLESAMAYGKAFNVEPGYLLNGESENPAQGTAAPTAEALRAVMTEGARIARLSQLPPEYIADMMLEALEAYADEPAASDPAEFARIHLGALKRRSAAR